MLSLLKNSLILLKAVGGQAGYSYNSCDIVSGQFSSRTCLWSYFGVGI